MWRISWELQRVERGNLLKRRRNKNFIMNSDKRRAQKRGKSNRNAIVLDCYRKLMILYRYLGTICYVSWGWWTAAVWQFSVSDLPRTEQQAITKLRLMITDLKLMKSSSCCLHLATLGCAVVTIMVTVMMRGVLGDQGWLTGPVNVEVQVRRDHSMVTSMLIISLTVSDHRGATMDHAVQMMIALQPAHNRSEIQRCDFMGNNLWEFWQYDPRTW